MIGTLAALTLAALAAGTATDTTLAVKPGTRLALSQFSGAIVVRSWSRNAVRVVADHGSRVTVGFAHKGPTLEVSGVHARGIPATVDYRLTVPKWMALELSGVNTDLQVEGVDGEVRLETIQGQVSVRGGASGVKATSIEGDVVVEGAAGRIDCSSVNGAVRVERATGPVNASTINGDVVLERVDSGAVEASTINGSLRFAGAIRDGGAYRFSTHNGDLTVTIPERASARVSVDTYGGNFSSSFPVQGERHRHGKRLQFTLGGGSALLELESFQGEIRLDRAGSGKR